MSRRVSPWTWRRALRDHGPKHPGELLTLFVIGTYMKRSGEAYPGQALIAKGARCSKRTVQRHITSAKDTGWITVYLAGKSGQQWRHSMYQASVPDWLVLDDLDEELSDCIESEG